MFYSTIAVLGRFIIFALFLLPMTGMAANDLPQQVNRLQNQMIEVNEKISTIASDQQKAALKIDALQSGLSTAHQELNKLKFNKKQSAGFQVAALRKANGRGIRKH